MVDWSKLEGDELLEAVRKLSKHEKWRLYIDRPDVYERVCVMLREQFLVECAPQDINSEDV
jgi:hypothetical protein